MRSEEVLLQQPFISSTVRLCWPPPLQHRQWRKAYHVSGRGTEHEELTGCLSAHALRHTRLLQAEVAAANTSPAKPCIVSIDTFFGNNWPLLLITRTLALGIRNQQPVFQ